MKHLKRGKRGEHYIDLITSGFYYFTVFMRIIVLQY